MEQPLVRVEAGEEVYYPKFTKNTRGKWEIKDKSLQAMNRRRNISKRPSITPCEGRSGLPLSGTP